MTTEKVRHYIQRARTAKHYVIRAKRVECMAKARRAASEAQS